MVDVPKVSFSCFLYTDQSRGNWLFKNILIVKVHLWSERGPGHRENRGTEHCGTAAACSTWNQGWGSNSKFFTRTASQKNKLIVVVPLILDLHLKLERKFGEFFFKCTLHAHQPIFTCPGLMSWRSEGAEVPDPQDPTILKNLALKFLEVRSYLKPATQSWSNACSRSVCFRKNL